jgi:propane monooxygenase reductase component
VREELGIEIRIEGLLLQRPYDYADRRVDLWFYVARRVSGEPKAIGCTEWRWVTPDELLDLPLPDASEPVLDALRLGGWLARVAAEDRERTGTILASRRLAPDVVEVMVGPQAPGGEEFRAGQYWMLSPGPGLRSAFSIASPPCRHHEIAFCIKLTGADGAARAITDLPVGSEIRYTGPHGSFILRPDAGRDPIFIAMGTGVAPLRSMILERIEQRRGCRIDLVFGAREIEDLIYADEFRHLESVEAGFHYHPFLSRPPAHGWKGGVGRFSGQLDRVLPAVAGREAYLCGNREMVTQSIESLTALGIDPSLCFHEEWG